MALHVRIVFPGSHAWRWRLHMASPYLDETLSEELRFFLDFAATTIQRHFRGYAVRKAYYASVSRGTGGAWPGLIWDC